MAQVLIPVLAFLAVVSAGGAVLVVRAARRRGLEQRLYGQQAFGGGHATVTAPPLRAQRLTDTLEQVGRAVSKTEPQADLRERLTHAGFYDPAAATIYSGAQLLLVVLGIALGGLLALSLRLSLVMGLCVVFGVVAAAGLMPNLFVSMRCSGRRREVQRQLPDAIDLMEICVSSGMGLDQSWNSVADEFRQVSPTLADEMSLATMEINLGAPRAQALRNMARRTGVDDISSLVATLVQSERFGTSVSQALRTYAEAMRTERSQRAEEQAEKLAVTMLFPMVLFIFPCIFVVILGPAGIKISEMFAGG
jgi:tight adherence protein C